MFFIGADCAAVYRGKKTAKGKSPRRPPARKIFCPAKFLFRRAFRG
jgi:hypothetical protein